MRSLSDTISGSFSFNLLDSWDPLHYIGGIGYSFFDKYRTHLWVPAGIGMQCLIFNLTGFSLSSKMDEICNEE
jgi:hypothetical protein